MENIQRTEHQTIIQKEVINSEEIGEINKTPILAFVEPRTTSTSTLDKTPLFTPQNPTGNRYIPTIDLLETHLNASSQNSSKIETEETATPSSTTISEMIVFKADEANVQRTLALFIVFNESSYNPFAIGDTYLICEKTGKPIRSRGLWQWNDCAHPWITDEMAFNPIISTNLAMAELKKGIKQCLKLWTTCRKFYGLSLND